MTRRARIVFAALAVTVAILAVAALFANDVASRMAEARLRSLTGQPWRVKGRFGLALSPSLGVAVDHVDASLDLEGVRPVRISVDRLHVAGSPLALARGAVPEHATLDGLAVALPSEWWRRLPSRTGAGLGPAGLPVPDRVTVRNGSILLVDASGRPEASLSGLDVDRASSADGEHLALALRLGSSPLRFDATLAGGTDGRTMAHWTLQSPLVPGGTATGDGAVQTTGTRLAAPRLAGRAGGGPFAGAATLDWAGKPRIDVDLSFARLALPGPPTDGESGPTDAHADLAALFFFDGAVAVRAGEVQAGPVPLTDLAASATVRDGVLTASLERAGLFGGQVSGSATMTPDADAVTDRVTAELHGVRLGPLLAATGRGAAPDGTLSATVALAGRGTDSAAFLRSASGAARVTLDDLRVDLSAVPGALRTALGEVSGVRSDATGQTPVFEHVAASFAVAGGRATSDDVVASGPALTARGAGSADLSAGTVAFRFEPRLVGGNRLLRSLDLRVPILIDGPVLSPRVVPDLAGASASGTGLGLDDLGALGDLAAGLLGGGPGGLGGRPPSGSVPRDPPLPRRR